MDSGSMGWWGVPLGVIGGAIRVSVPFMFVGLGECITEKSGRVNLGLEGTLIMGAMTGFGVSYLTGSPWLGVLAAACVGGILGAVHASLCGLPKVNDVAVGIAMMLFGTGLAFFLGKALVKPVAPKLGGFTMAFFSTSEPVRNAFEINGLFILGVIAAPTIWWLLKNTRWGLILRTVGESGDTARALGYSPNRVRLLATMAGGFLAGIGGSFLSLFSPGNWAENLSTGQGLMAVALVIFARWDPLRCLLAALLFGGATALGPALQSVGVKDGRYLFDAAPYVFTLAIMIAFSSPRRTMAGAPGELTMSK